MQWRCFLLSTHLPGCLGFPETRATLWRRDIRSYQLEHRYLSLWEQLQCFCVKQLWNLINLFWLEVIQKLSNISTNTKTRSSSQSRTLQDWQGQPKSTIYYIIYNIIQLYNSEICISVRKYTKWFYKDRLLVLGLYWICRSKSYIIIGIRIKIPIIFVKDIRYE